MDWLTPAYLLIAVGLVVLNGFFVLAEFSLVKVRTTRIEELAKKRDRRAIVAQQMVMHLDNYLAATQLGITVASLGLGWVGEKALPGLIDAVIGGRIGWSPAVSLSISASIAFLIITFLHILLGELAPKSLAIRRPESSTLLIAYPMLWAYRLFYIPMRILNGASNMILKVVGLESEHPEVAHSEQELKMVLSMAQPSMGLSLNRLLILENIFDLGHQKVMDAMIPWTQVKYLLTSMPREEVMRQLLEHRFSRWPVLDQPMGPPVGYFLMKDIVAALSETQDWRKLVRPLRNVHPNDNLEATMQQLQKEGANMAVVIDGNRPIGLITLEDILEEIVGRIEDEYPRLPRLFLKDSLTNGGVALDLPATTPQDAIRSLVALIPERNLPAGSDVCALALERERQMTTDVGYGVAIPHARCPQLARPLIVFGRSIDGIVAGDPPREPVHLIFLVVTPAERPNIQVFLLAQLANVARSEFVRERLMRAQTPDEVFEIIAAADPAVTG